MTVTGIEQFQVRQLIYGCLFYPLSVDESFLPEGVRADCRKGRWLYVSDWTAHFPQVDAVYIVPKHLWPIELTDELLGTLPLVSLDDLQAAAAERCVLFALPSSTEPYFLVPDRWPSAQA